MLDLVCSGIFNFHGLLIHSDKIKKQLNKRKSETQRFDWTFCLKFFPNYNECWKNSKVSSLKTCFHRFTNKKTDSFKKSRNFEQNENKKNQKNPDITLSKYI